MNITREKSLYGWIGPVYNNYKVIELYIKYYLCISFTFEFICNLFSDDETPVHFDICLFDLIQLNIMYSKNKDHAGLRIYSNILGLDFSFEYYDIRHYDHDEEKFEECDLTDINKNYYLRKEQEKIQKIQKIQKKSK